MFSIKKNMYVKVIGQAYDSPSYAHSISCFPFVCSLTVEPHPCTKDILKAHFRLTKLSLDSEVGMKI